MRDWIYSEVGRDGGKEEKNRELIRHIFNLRKMGPKTEWYGDCGYG